MPPFYHSPLRLSSIFPIPGQAFGIHPSASDPTKGGFLPAGGLLKAISPAIHAEAIYHQGLIESAKAAALPAPGQQGGSPALDPVPASRAVPRVPQLIIAIFAYQCATDVRPQIAPCFPLFHWRSIFRLFHAFQSIHLSPQLRASRPAQLIATHQIPLRPFPICLPQQLSRSFHPATMLP